MADHICPWWVGYLLANPLRRIIENPDKILGRFVKEGMTAVDYGCGMGFFTLPLAKMVGPGGKVIAVDVQKKMLDSLNKRAQRAGLLDRIEPVLVNSGKPAINGPVDFVAALYVVHELPDTIAFFSQMVDVMKKGAKLLMVEPGFHVTEKDFREAVNTATSIGLKMTDEQVFIRGRAAVLEAPGS